MGLLHSPVFKYPRMQSLSDKYCSEFSGEPEILLPFDRERFEYYHGIYPRMTEENLEVMSSGYNFYKKLLDHDSFFLHSSAVVSAILPPPMR